MHFISDTSQQRVGYVYDKMGLVGRPKGSKPTVNWKHIDGPLLIMTDNTLHWLTLWERFQLYFGYITLEELDIKHRSH